MTLRNLSAGIILALFAGLTINAARTVGRGTASSRGAEAEGGRGGDL